MKSTLLTVMVFVASALPSFAGNTLGTATNITPGGGWVQISVPAACCGDNYYTFNGTANRSYCVETMTGDNVTSTGDSFLTVYDALTAPIGSNDNQAGEPNGAALSRYCFIPASSGTLFAAVHSATAGAESFHLRVVETTLYGPYAFVGSGFEGFLLLKNTTNTSVNVTVRLLNAADGSLANSVSTAIPANANLNYALSQTPISLAPGAYSIEVAHNGAPGAVMGAVTSIGFGSGVSFDTPLSPRQDFGQ